MYEFHWTQLAATQFVTFVSSTLKTRLVPAIFFPQCSLDTDQPHTSTLFPLVSELHSEYLTARLLLQTSDYCGPSLAKHNIRILHLNTLEAS